MSHSTATSLAELRAHTQGRVIIPPEPGFDAACATWNTAFRHHPAVVVIPKNTDDVIRAVRYAADHDLGITVQATGHGVARAAQGTMLLLTSDLVDVAVDPDAWTARIGGGACWHHVIGPAQSAGLAPLVGSSLDVGAVGYTLGGGMGWLARKYGLSLDHVRSLEIVTIDGATRVVSEENDEELFWGLGAGGAGCFGVITSMEVDLAPVTRVYAGNLRYPAGDAAEVGNRFRAWVDGAPDELTASLVFVRSQPESFALVRGCFLGSDADGVGLLEHWRRWRRPDLDTWGPMPFADVAAISDDPVGPLPRLTTAEWLADLPADAIEALSRQVLWPAAGSAMLQAEIRHAGGAISFPQVSSPARHHRDRFLLQVTGVADDNQGLGPLRTEAHELRTALAPWITGRTYLNFLEGNEKLRRARAAFEPATWHRLQRLKQSVDAANRFQAGLPLVESALAEES